MIVDVDDVMVTYQDGTTAVRNISLQIPEGQFFGFLGPNGAGKTTFVKTLATLLTPTSGTVHIDGCDAVQDPQSVRERIGYMPQETSIDEELTGRENLRFACESYGVPQERRDERIDELLRLVSLEDASSKTAKTYSGGMRKRLDAATALVHQPKLVFLDEPTTGLDPAARNQLWEHFKAISDHGTSVFLTTQYLDEADFLCEDIGVIENGKIIARDSPQGLKERVGGDIITVQTPHVDDAQSIAEEAALFENHQITRHSEELSITTQNASERLADYLIALKDNDVDITSVNIRGPTLDDVFLSITDS